MRRVLTALLVGVAMIFVAAPQALSFYPSTNDRQDHDLPETEEINQSYKLSPGASVEVSSINGPVVIETSYTDTAEVHIIRSARTREDLQYHKINISHSPSSLVVSGARDDVRDVQVRHRVTLKIPRQVELTAKSVNGTINIGEIDGPVVLKSINGRLELGQALDHVELSSINGRVTMTIARLGERGIRMSSINGAIDIHVLDGLNADIDVTQINGNVRAEMPNVSLQKVSRSSFRGQIGGGGIPLTMSNINGTITIR